MFELALRGLFSVFASWIFSAVFGGALDFEEARQVERFAACIFGNLPQVVFIVAGIPCACCSAKVRGLHGLR